MNNDLMSLQVCNLVLDYNLMFSVISLPIRPQSGQAQPGKFRRD